METLSPWGVRFSARFIGRLSPALFIWLFRNGTESRHQGHLGFPWALVIYTDLALLVGLGWASLAFSKGTTEEAGALFLVTSVLSD